MLWDIAYSIFPARQATAVAMLSGQGLSIQAALPPAR